CPRTQNPFLLKINGLLTIPIGRGRACLYSWEPPTRREPRAARGFETLVQRAHATFSNQPRDTAAPGRKADLVPTLVARPLVGGIGGAWMAGAEAKSADLHRALRQFHLLLRSDRLYDKNHPRRLQSLEDAYESIRVLA